MARLKMEYDMKTEGKGAQKGVAVRELPDRYEALRAGKRDGAVAKEGREKALGKVSTRAVCGRICETYALGTMPAEIVELLGAVWEVCAGDTEMFRTWSLVIDKKEVGGEFDSPFESTHPLCAPSKEGFIGHYLWKHGNGPIGWAHIEGTTQSPRLATSIDIDVERGRATISCPHRKSRGGTESAVLEANARRLAEAFGFAGLR